jgi:universal stress protein F
MYKKILVPIDVSHLESGELGLNAAAKIAKASGAELVLLSVIADLPNLVASQLPADFAKKAAASTEEQLKGIAKKCGLADGSYQTAVRDGPAHHEILSEAESVGADLIVVASHRPELSDYLLGSVAAKVVRHADCSVLVVRK